MTVFNFLLEATVFGSLMILLLLMVSAMFRGKLGNRVIYIAWFFVALRLLLPLSFPNPAMDEFRPGYSVDMEARPVANQVRERFIDASFGISSFVYPHGNRANLMQTLGSETSYGHMGKWVLAFYLAAMILVAVWMCARNLRFRRRLWRDRVSALNGDALDMYRELCKRYNVKPIPVYFVDPLPAACLVGAVRPFIAVPFVTLSEHLPFVLSHEICHQKVHDGALGAMRHLCCLVHWFNPLVWFAARQSRLDSELACDDRVLQKLSLMDRLAYADALVSTAERGGTKPCVLATGTTFTNKSLRKRITSIIQCARVKRWAVALSSTMAVCVLIFAFATSESEPLPTVSDIPQVNWVASLTDLTSEPNALAYARRFLESPFIKVDTSSMGFILERMGSIWQVLASNKGDIRPLILRFGTNGYIFEYDGTRVLDGLNTQSETYTHRTFTESLGRYLHEFMLTQLPAQGWSGGHISRDVRVRGVRYVRGRQVNDAGKLVYKVTVEVEPVVRVLKYQAGEARN